MLNIKFNHVAQKNIKKIEKSNPNAMKPIISKIDELREDPLPNSTKKLKSYENLYRVRVKEYRIIYEFDSKTLIIVMIDLRAKIYEILKRLSK